MEQIEKVWLSNHPNHSVFPPLLHGPAVVQLLGQPGSVKGGVFGVEGG